MSTALLTELHNLKEFPTSRSTIQLDSSSLRGFLFARMIISRSPLIDRTVIICTTKDDAQQLFDDIKSMLILFGGSNFVNLVSLYRGWERSPYGSLAPSIADRFQRLECLDQIEFKKIQLLVTDIVSFSQKTIAPNSWSARKLILEKGLRLQKETLESWLLNFGYTRTEQVEDKGTFNSRGYLLDIYPSTSSKPLRIEFFDNEIELIRSFDPQTQRSDGTLLESFTLRPAIEWENTSHATDLAKNRIKSYCDNSGIPKQVRDKLCAQFDHPNLDPYWEYLLPALENVAPVSDHLLDWNSILCNDLYLLQEIVTHHTERGLEHSKKLARGELALPCEWYFQTEKEVEAHLSKSKLILQSPSTLKVQKPEVIDIHKALNDLELQNKKWNEEGTVRIIAASSQSQSERVRFLLGQRNISHKVVKTIDLKDSTCIQIAVGTVSKGFSLPNENLHIITDEDLFGGSRGARFRIKKHAEKREKKKEQQTAFLSNLDGVSPGDLLVHSFHGIGKYQGLQKITADGVLQDFLLLEYADGDKLYLPIYRLDLVQKYVGGTEATSLDKLGSAQFEKAKDRAKKSLQNLAQELLKLYARRATRQGLTYGPNDEEFQEFEARFPFQETSDQFNAIEDVINDMRSPKIMDRLICGDVGYGKTEVAMRAAFKAAQEGRQVAVLVPTTILAFQHERSFIQRFQTFPYVIAGLSRFKSTKETKETIEKISNGQIDIVIGTHRLLSKDVTFKNLGLVIVDEEHRFGVEHKEKLKMLCVNADVLTLTATPIPRTLQMSFMGIRDISIINTPPIDRLSIRTFISRSSEETIRQALEQEISRGGQAYFVHNRVQSIYDVADQLQKMMPRIKFGVAHGQMTEKELESKMIEFYEKKFEVLICTTIIESGIDIPTANTIIIDRADTFGLAQLYQLRGRVGRSQMRAFCYLLLPPQGAVQEVARKRLEVIQRFVDLGSGFKVASHDLELRGGGDILGKSQSGNIAALGLELYTDLLDEAIRSLKGEIIEEKFDPEIKLPVTSIIPETYIPDSHQRLSFYKKIAQVPHSSETLSLDQLQEELQDRFGPLPPETINLFWLIRIKSLLIKCKVKSVIVGKDKIAMEAGDKSLIHPDKALAKINSNPRDYTLASGTRIVINKLFKDAQSSYDELLRLLSAVADMKT